MDMRPYQKRTWCEIDLGIMRHNFIRIKETVGNAKICCVVKANAYGHGAVPISKLYQQLGADFFAVSNIEEAIQLREGEITLPILILGYTNPHCVDMLSRYDISQCVFSREYAECLAREAEKNSVNIKIHIKLDTGMGRIGFPCKNENELDDIVEVCRRKCFMKEGIFTHFASADEGENGRLYTEAQFALFQSAISYLKGRHTCFEICHCANSAAIIDYPQSYMDMVRAGLVLYGFWPSEEVKQRFTLLPAMCLRSIVDYIKIVQPGECISYGRTYVAEKTMKVATLPIGYADGLLRANGNKMSVEINGCAAPIIGRVCMDQCMVDITDIDDVEVGSVATIYGTSDYNHVDEIAKRNNTISYEILCNVGERVPRIYIDNNLVVSVLDKIVY